MKTRFTNVMLPMIFVTALSSAFPNCHVCGAETRADLIQLAILLDTSASMSGLIEQAKSRLWTVVNEFTTTIRDGRRPAFQVALYEYGKSSLAAAEGYVRQIVPLSDDLDRVSEELFALTTNGGEEYCGWVIRSATQELQWSESPDALKAIFIAGNEPFTQGPVRHDEACREAVARGITVNTIFCGPQSEGIAGHWRDGSVLADGQYLSIDHNHRLAHIATPQDAEIARLGVALNRTYVPYGKLGNANRLRQEMQDSNSVKAGSESNTLRVLCKCSHLYQNTSWDLLDALREGKVELEKLKKEDLPEALRELPIAKQRAYLDARARERQEIQEKVQSLNEARKKIVAAERKKQRNSGEETLDSAIIKCVRAQAAKKAFRFAEDTAGKSPGKTTALAKEKKS